MPFQKRDRGGGMRRQIPAKPLTPEQFRRVLVSFRGPMALRNRALFELGVDTGFRISALLSLDLGDVVTPEGHIAHEVWVVRRHTKGKHRSHSAGLGSEVRHTLHEWVTQANRFGVVLDVEPLFCTTTGRRVSLRHASKILKGAFLRAGLPRLGYSTHTMRKTFAHALAHDLTRRVAYGEAINIVLEMQHALNHRHITSTTSYLSVTPDVLPPSHTARRQRLYQKPQNHPICTPGAP